MDKEEKILVLNEIHNFSLEIEERLLPIVRNACKFGLRKCKHGSAEWIIMRLRALADALEDYHHDDFNLDDMQNYEE